MKTNFLENWKVVLVLAALPVVTAILQTPGSVTNVVAAETADDDSVPANPVAAATDTNQAAEAVSANAAADTNQVVVKPSAPTLPDLKLTPGAKELIKLAQSGVSEDVMLAYITNSTTFFSLGPDEIIYLNDLGLSSALVTAMILHDSALGSATATNVLATMPITLREPEPQPVQPVTSIETAMPTTPDYVDYGGYPTVDYSTPQDTSYFYDSLAPYGSWVPVAGYGLCWQPTVYARNPAWRPYCDNGRWIYSDCGWYWQSDYSWGWAAFHYGRWYCDTSRGWVWAPNRVWGPAWVSWRQTGDHCGWAPLPPAARFTAGVGFSYHNQPVSAGFGFGLGVGLYTFIPVSRMCDYAPSRYCVTGAPATRLYNQATVVNNVTVQNNKVFNGGVSPSKVESSAHVPVRRAVIQETQIRPGHGPLADRVEKRGDTLTVVRPSLPETGTKSDGRRGGRGEGIAAGTRGRAESPRGAGTTSVPVAGNPTAKPAPGSPPSVSDAKSATTSSATSGTSDRRPRVEVFKRADAEQTPASSKPILLPNNPTTGNSATSAPRGSGNSKGDNTSAGEKVASSSTTTVPERKPRVEVFQRPESQQPKTTTAPLILPKPSVADNSATPSKPEVYPPNSIVLKGPKPATPAASTAPRSTAEISRPETSFTVKVPRSTFGPPAQPQTYTPPANATGRSSAPGQSFNRPASESSSAGQNANPSGFNLGGGQGRNGFNAGPGNYSAGQNVTRSAPAQSQAPILLPSRTGGQSSPAVSAPVRSAPAYQAPVSAPVRQPQSAPIMVPQPRYSAPPSAPAAAPAPAPAQSAPAQSQSQSQSSSRPGGGNSGAAQSSSRGGR